MALISDTKARIERNPLTFDRVARIVFGTLIVLAIYLIVKRLSNILLPFLIGWLLAYILNPVVEFFQFMCRIKNRIISVLITLLVVIGVITGLVFLLSPLISSEIDKVAALIKEFMQNVDVNVIVPHHWQLWLRKTFLTIDINRLMTDNGFNDFIQNAMPKVWGFLTGSLSFVIGFIASFIALLYMIFIMIDYRSITKAIFNIFPPQYRTLSSEILNDIGATMNRYFRGQFLIAACVAVMISVGFVIIGLPLGVMMGIFVGICSLVPYMQFLSMPPVVLLGLLQCSHTGQNVWTMILAIFIVYSISQLIQDLILTPKIMGKVTGLKPAYILLSLSIWGALLGIVGMIIALPLTQLCFSYYKRFILGQKVEKYWEHRKQ